MGDAPAKQASLSALLQASISALSHGKLPPQNVVAMLISKVRDRSCAVFISKMLRHQMHRHHCALDALIIDLKEQPIFARTGSHGSMICKLSHSTVWASMARRIWRCAYGQPFLVSRSRC